AFAQRGLTGESGEGGRAVRRLGSQGLSAGSGSIDTCTKHLANQISGERRLPRSLLPPGSGSLLGYLSPLLRCEPLCPSLAACRAPVPEKLGIAVSDLPQLIP